LTNYITGGNLLLRYMGETAGTLAGIKDKDLNQITTNRLTIFTSDLELFTENPIFGVGAAASKYQRSMLAGEVAHVELSRLLAEHGIFAFGIIIGLFYVFFTNLSGVKNKLSKGLLVSFAVLSVYTTFHAATRTFMSPMLMAMACVILVEEKSVKNKPVKKETPSKVIQ
jgi:O-antigen ligase